MSKKITSLLIIFIMITAFALTANADDAKNKAFWTDISGNKVNQLNIAVGGETTIRFCAEVPKGKTLNAYSFMIMYDENVTVKSVETAQGAVIPPLLKNAGTAGEILINGFDIIGTKESKLAFIDVTLTAKEAGTGYISVMTSAFGTDGKNQFKPKTDAVKVVTY